MKLPEIENPLKYTGLYVVDFGDHTAVGFKAREVAALLEQEQMQHIHIYKIHRAQPDGTLELKGVSPSVFHLEAGLFFYQQDETIARQEFRALLDLADQSAPPAMARAQLARTGDQLVIALIYPAEHDAEFSRWLLDAGYRTRGLTEGGISAVKDYDSQNPEILDRRQLLPQDQQILIGRELMQAAQRAVVR